MRTVRVTFADGNTITTSINGTDAEIEAYYLGKQFNLGDPADPTKDYLQTAVKVEFLREKADIRAACDAAAKEQAKIVGAAAWYEVADKVLTTEEKAEVRALWDAMPGNTCWVDAFLNWMKQPCDCCKDSSRPGFIWNAGAWMHCPQCNTQYVVTYRQANPTSWIAYRGRQAIWEDTTEGQLLAKLRQMGITSPKWDPITIAVCR